MRTRIVIVIALVLKVSIGFAQDQTQNASLFSAPQGFTIAGLRHAEPMFVVNADDRTLVIMPSATSGLKFDHALPSDLQAIDTGLIREITVYTGEDAIDRFGQPARNGAIVIGLKEGSFEKLPAHLADRFTVKK
jgi:hypothetical protein